MNLCVVVPSTEHLKTAGVRIRYMRLQKYLKAQGYTLSIKTVDSLNQPDALTHDVFLISKVYDVRSIILMRTLKQKGRLVGVDFFDNYFSQHDDVRLERPRAWLNTALPFFDFALCATENMKRLLERQFLENRPCHVVNDPYDKFDATKVANSLAEKVQYAQQSRELNVCWFGIADNPYFSVGLADVFAFREQLTRLSNSNYKINLTIISNLRTQKAERISMLTQLGLPYSLEEWSEDSEKAVIERSLVAYLPVNVQSFSTVKSLNRAISAFCGGAQVLSAGFPLYETFGQFVYRDATCLIEDLEQQKLLLRPDTMDDLRDQLDNLGNPKIEAEKLAAFLTMALERHPAKVANSTRCAVIHGRKIMADSHKYIKKYGSLSVASPFCTALLNYDVALAIQNTLSGEPEIQFSESAFSALTGKVADKADPRTFMARQKIRVITLRQLAPDGRWHFLAGISNSGRYKALSWYDMTIQAMVEILQILFGSTDIYLSELEAPFNSNTLKANRPVKRTSAFDAEAVDA